MNLDTLLENHAFLDCELALIFSFDFEEFMAADDAPILIDDIQEGPSEILIHKLF